MTDMKETEDTKEEVFPTHEEIEKLAYALYLTHRAAGREDSDSAALDDWLIAEQQLCYTLSERVNGVYRADVRYPETFINSVIPEDMAFVEPQEINPLREVSQSEPFPKSYSLPRKCEHRRSC
jgi:hypothetical protein